MEFLLKSTSILSLFYLVYVLFLRKDTFFESIRIYLLSGIFLSIVIPFITIKKYIVSEAVIPSIPINTISQEFIEDVSVLTWENFLWVVYFLGISFFTIRFFIQLSSIIWLLANSKSTQKNGYTFVKSTKNCTPFSFFRFVVYNPNQFNKKELAQIIAHEKIHVKQMHSLDQVLIQIVLIFNWFNPFVWMYSKEIEKNLEFIADDYAQGIAQENKYYQKLLLKTITPNCHLALTTNFYDSIIKKRIDMLQKKRTHKIMQLKFTLIIPILIGFVFVFNTEIVAQQKEKSEVDEFRIEVQTDMVVEYEIITKDTKESELIKMKNTFKSSYGTQFKYSKLKRNEQGEITGISLHGKTKSGKQASFNQKSTEPINPILISINHTSGELSIGNTTDNYESYAKRLTSDFIPKDNSFVFISTDDDSKTDSISVKTNIAEKEYVVFTKDGKVNDKNKSKVQVKSDTLIYVSDSGSVKSEIWIAEDKSIQSVNTKGKNLYSIKRINGADSITIGSIKNIIFISDNRNKNKERNVQIIKFGDDEGENEVIINGKKIKVKGDFIIKTDNASHIKNGKMMYYGLEDERPLIYVNGIEMKGGSINEIDPNMIKEVTVLKGKAATKKYGKKGENGVIIITTKKK